MDYVWCSKVSLLCSAPRLVYSLLLGCEAGREGAGRAAVKAACNIFSTWLQCPFSCCVLVSFCLIGPAYCFPCSSFSPSLPSTRPAPHCPDEHLSVSSRPIASPVSLIYSAAMCIHDGERSRVIDVAMHQGALLMDCVSSPLPF